MTLRLRRHEFADDATLMMAIVNRTPDSFYDKGATFAEDKAMERVDLVVEQGAEIVDIGGVKAGLGEEVMKNVSSFLIVELMRQGHSPQQACELAMQRILKRNPQYRDFQVGFIAINKQGETGSYCIHPGFTYARYSGSGNENVMSKSFL